MGRKVNPIGFRLGYETGHAVFDVSGGSRRPCAKKDFSCTQRINGHEWKRIVQRGDKYCVRCNQLSAVVFIRQLGLQRDFENVARRQRGYSIDDQERAEGMRCIAAPIFNAYGEPVAGLSVSGPAFRINLSDAAKIGQAVRDAARSVTEATGGEVPH